MTDDHEQARKWRRAMRQKLPPTETALTRALHELQIRVPAQMDPANKQVLDAVAIEALADAATVDGDLRRALEGSLERTFWFSTTPPSAPRENTLTRGTYYASQVGQMFPDAAMKSAVYRSGLRLGGCVALRDKLAANLDPILVTLRVEPPNRDQNLQLLLELSLVCAATLEELSGLRDVTPESMRSALEMWIAGEDEAAITEQHPEVWTVIQPRYLESLLIWAVTGAIEIIAALAGDPGLREISHLRLEPSRLRYGTCDASLCPLIRDGAG